MSAPAFDTAEYCNTLKQSGVPEQQADGHLEGLRNVITNNLATKQDLETVKTELKNDIRSIGKSTVIWLGSAIFVASTGIVGFLTYLS